MAIDWTGIREEYEKYGTPVSELAARFRCHKSSIRKKAGREGWCKGAGLGAPELRPKDVLEEHKELWNGVKSRLVKGIKTADVKLGIEELKRAKIAGEVLSTVIKGERLAWGLDEGPGEDLTYGEADIAGEMDRVTASPGADEALD